MNKPILLLLFLFSSIVANAQNIPLSNSKVQHDTTAYYMRNDFVMATSEADAKSLRLIIKDKGGLFRIEDYYMDATPKMLAYSFSDKMNFEPGTQGKRIDYYPNGKKRIVNYYKSGQEVGGKELYYPNGNLYTVTMLENNNDPYLKKCLDSFGNALTDNGNGKWIDFGNFFESKTEGQVINGKREGEWTEITKTGEKNTGVYKNGVLVSGALFTNDTTVYGNADILPTFNAGEGGVNRFLAKNLKYPAYAREHNIQGKVVLAFIVEKDGSITHLRVIRGVEGGCTEEALRVIMLSPPWKPGYLNGRPVRVKYSLPIAFAIAGEK
jgi:antitoxin component YwqK of YwqJK toxin-antitoxin module